VAGNISGKNRQIEKGDLVKMIRAQYSEASKSPVYKFLNQTMLVIDAHKGAVKILFPDGTIKSDLAEHFIVVSKHANR